MCFDVFEEADIVFTRSYFELFSDVLKEVDMANKASSRIFCYNTSMYQYPKLCLLCGSFILAYVLYQIGALDWFGHALNGHGYASMFLGGMLFSYGFTAPFGIGIFVEMGHEVHPLIAAPLAGIGALLSDLFIFSIVRYSAFHDEIHKIQFSRPMIWIRSILHHESVSDRMRNYILWAFAGIIIGSPLPDEFGVMLLGSATELKGRQLAILCFTLNTIGIFVILLTSRVVG